MRDVNEVICGNPGLCELLDASPTCAQYRVSDVAKALDLPEERIEQFFDVVQLRSGGNGKRGTGRYIERQELLIYRSNHCNHPYHTSRIS